jgi:hypothetical protein
MKNLQIYDNGGESLDRYTIFKARQKGVGYCQNGRIFEGVGASKFGALFYMHIECVKGSHLGKRIKFEDLEPELQGILINEFK